MKRSNLFVKELVQGFLLSWEAGKKYVIYNIVLSIFTSLLPILSLWYIKKIIDIITLFGAVAKEEFIYTLITLLVIQLIQAGLLQLLKDIQTVQQQMITDHLSRKVLDKAVTVDYPYYENSRYFNSLHMAQQEVLYRSALLTTSYNQLIQNGISMLALGILFLQLNWLYAIFVIVAAIPVLVVKWKHAVASQHLEKQNLLNERRASYLSRVLTDAAHAKEVRTFGFGEAFIGKFRDLRQHIFLGKKRLSANQHWTETIIQAIEIAITGIIIFKLGLRTFEGLITIGSFILYLQALQRLQSGFNQFLVAFTQLFRQRYFVRNIMEFMQLPVKANGEHSENKFPGVINKGVAVKDLSFTYPGSNAQVLDNINMHFEKGKVTAIIGENGCGKSTLVKLLARLYEVQEGEIRVDAEQIGNISAHEYYTNTSFLFQDYSQYHFTIAENISLEKTPDEHRLNSAATTSGIMELVEEQPKKFETHLGRMFGMEGNVQLSGGQWQKIALARMLYRNTQVMVLDEPTSNIDPLAEFELLKKISAYKQDRVIILITHKLHNLKFADHVYVMDKGSVQGEGTVEDLLRSNVVFRKMYERQELDKSVESN